MENEDKIKVLWFCYISLVILVITITYIVIHEDKTDVTETQVEETESTLNEENEFLKQQMSMLEENVEMLSFEIEELYSVIESGKQERTELKDVLNLSESEIELLARLVKCEAGGEPFECKVLICLVVFNRMFDSNFKNTLNKVIYEKGQFSPVESNAIHTAIPTEDCYFAVKIALSLTYNEINEFYGTDLMFFRRATEEKIWGKNTTYAFTIGKTDFYRLTK